MKKIILLVLMSISVLVHANQTSNYLINGSFESGLHHNWVYYVSNRSEAEFSLSNNKKIFDDGSYCLKVDVDKLDRANNVYARTQATLANDSLYLLQFWAHGPEEAKLYVEIEGAVQKGIWFDMRVGNKEARGQMVAYHYPFKINPSYKNKTINITFYFNSMTSIEKSDDTNDCWKRTVPGCTYHIDGLVLVDQSNDMHHDVFNTYLWNYNQIPNKDNQSWIAGDNDVSFDLPDGRRMWFFNDSFYGNNIPGNNVFPGGTFVRNAVVIENHDGSLNSLPVTNQGGQWTYFRIPESDVVRNSDGGVANCFWVGDALIEDDMVKVYLIEVYGNDRSYLGKFTYPELEFVGIEEQEPFCRRYEKFFVENDKVYLYANGGSGWTRTMMVARCDLGDLNGKKGTWRFWDGNSWSTTDKKHEVSQRGADDVIKLDEGNYVQLAMPVMSPEVYVLFAPSPEGPWGHEKLVAIGDRSANYWYYMPNFHGQLPNGKYSISMSANYHGCLFFCQDCEHKLYADKYWYRQRYVQVDLLALSPYTTNMKDCAGVENGTAFYDTCGNCVGGTTGKTPCVTGKAELYTNINYSGSAIGLNAGEYTSTVMSELGFNINSLTSLKIHVNYVVELYSQDNFGGEKAVLEGEKVNLNEVSFKDNIKSLKVKRKAFRIEDGIYAIQNNQSKLYVGVENNSKANNALLVQKAYLGDDTQKFQFTHIGDDYYAIRNVGAGKEVSVVGMSKKSSALVELWDGFEYNIMTDGGEVTAQYSDSPDNERVHNLIDNNVNTKFLTFHNRAWVRFKANLTSNLSKYSITSANDAAGRDPKEWILSGSTDGNNWEVIDTRSDISFARRFEEKTFVIENNDKDYLYYQIDMTCAVGNMLQLAELKLFANTNKQQNEYFDNQMFIVQEVSNEIVKIINKRSDMMLEILDGVKDQNIKVWQNEDIGQHGGYWVLRNPDDIESSVQMNYAEKYISLYPNPANTWIKLESKTVDNIQRVVVSDIGGSIIADYQVNEMQTSLSVAEWNNGVYIVKVFTVNDSYTYKLVKN